VKDRDITRIIEILNKSSRKWEVPIVSFVAETSRDPFKVLISTVLSLRTKDETTRAASERLFKLADSPSKMLKLSEGEIQEAIYPVGFYRVKAKNILDICTELVHKHNSNVPDDLDTLLKLRGVGRKTANLVISLGFNKHGICVDTHVHRISNRLGYIKTKNPFETEMALRSKLPKKYWIEYNGLLVALGQHLCKPVSPFCTKCPVTRYCDRVGVSKSR